LPVIFLLSAIRASLEASLMTQGLNTIPSKNISSNILTLLFFFGLILFRFSSFISFFSFAALGGFDSVFSLATFVSLF